MGILERMAQLERESKHWPAWKVADLVDRLVEGGMGGTDMSFSRSGPGKDFYGDEPKKLSQKLDVLNIDKETLDNSLAKTYNGIADYYDKKSDTLKTRIAARDPNLRHRVLRGKPGPHPKMSKQEDVLAEGHVRAAAIRHQGKVYTGQFHSDIINTLVAAGHFKDMDDYFSDPKGSEEGFVDHNGEFLNREQAKLLAKKADQVDKEHPQTDAFKWLDSTEIKPDDKHYTGESVSEIVDSLVSGDVDFVSWLSEAKKHGRIGARFKEKLQLRKGSEKATRRSSLRSSGSYASSNYLEHVRTSLQKIAQKVVGVGGRHSRAKYPKDAWFSQKVSVPGAGEWNLTLKPQETPDPDAKPRTSRYQRSGMLHRLHVDCRHCDRTIPVGRLGQHIEGAHPEEHQQAQDAWTEEGYGKEQGRLDKEQERLDRKSGGHFEQKDGNCGLIAPFLAGHHGADLPAANELRDWESRILDDHKLKLKHVHALKNPRQRFDSDRPGNWKYRDSTVEEDIQSSATALETSLGDHLHKSSRGRVIDHLNGVAASARRGVLPQGYNGDTASHEIRRIASDFVRTQSEVKQREEVHKRESNESSPWYSAENHARATRRLRLANVAHSKNVQKLDDSTRSVVHNEAVRMLEHSARSIRPHSPSGHYITVSGSFEPHPLNPADWRLRQKENSDGTKRGIYHVAFEHGTHGQLNYGARQNSDRPEHDYQVVGRIPLRSSPRGSHVPSPSTHGCFSCNAAPGKPHNEEAHERRATDSSPQHSLKEYERLFGS